MLVWRDNRTLRFEGADSSSEGQDASLRLVHRGDWAVDALAYVQARNFSNVVISSSRFTPVLDQYNTPSTGVGGKLELRPPEVAGHQLRLGADYRRASGTMMENAISAFSGDITERRRAGGANEDLGLFAEDDWTLGALVLTGGVRADRTAITGGYLPRGRSCGRARSARIVCRPHRLDRHLARRGAVPCERGAGPARGGLSRHSPADPERAVPPLRRLPGRDPGERAARERGTAGVRGGRRTGTRRRAFACRSPRSTTASRRHRQRHPGRQPAPAPQPASHRRARDRGGCRFRSRRASDFEAR